MTIQGINSRNLGDSMIMRSIDVGGLCIMLSGTEAERLKVLEQLLSLKQPVVVFQQEVRGKNKHLCLVRQDDYYGGRLVGGHLLSKDLKDLLILRPNQNWPAIENRIRGLNEVLSNSMIQPKITILDTGSESFSDVQTSLSNYLDRHSLPDSILICETVHSDDPWRDYIITEGFSVEKEGRFFKPYNKPGLGIEINDDEIIKHPFLPELPQRVFYKDGSVGDW